MIFTYGRWDKFCGDLAAKKMLSIPACCVKPETETYLVLKHDVETDVVRAYRMAQIEQKYGHRGSYYVQAYLMQDAGNVALLQKMQQMGHEVSYHYDVLDSCKGDLAKADEEFEANKRIFEDNGFCLRTVCQHGNPVAERIGYTSNRDFFRSALAQEKYPDIADIMVDYPVKYQTKYCYFSDAGRKFQLIYDPIDNDRVKSDDQNIPYETLEDLLAALSVSGGNIVSTHPHRWTKSAGEYMVKHGLFTVLKHTAKLLLHIPGMKKIMGRFYYLAKKI